MKDRELSALEPLARPFVILGLATLGVAIIGIIGLATGAPGWVFHLSAPLAIVGTALMGGASRFWAYTSIKRLEYVVDPENALRRYGFLKYDDCYFAYPEYVRMFACKP